MSDMPLRRAIIQAASDGVKLRGKQGAAMLVSLPALVAALLESVSGEPVRAYLAIGKEEIAAYDQCAAELRTALATAPAEAE